MKIPLTQRQLLPEASAFKRGCDGAGFKLNVADGPSARGLGANREHNLDTGGGRRWNADVGVVASDGASNGERASGNLRPGWAGQCAEGVGSGGVVSRPGDSGEQ